MALAILPFSLLVAVVAGPVAQQAPNCPHRFSSTEDAMSRGTSTDIEQCLLLTVMHGTPEELDALIQAGADLDAHISDYQGTPLHLAAEHNEDPEMAATLLRAGADVNVRNVIDATPLHAAAKNDNVEVAETLIRAGAALNPVTYYRSDHGARTPLIVAVQHGNLPVVKALLRAGADASDETNHGKSALLFAVAPYFFEPRPVNLEMVQVLLRAGAPTETGSDSPLHTAVRRCDLDVVAVLLDAGADVGFSGDSWNRGSALHVAATFCSDPNVAEALLAAGGDPSAPDDGGATPLEVAEQEGNEAVARVFRDSMVRTPGR